MYSIHVCSAIFFNLPVSIVYLGTRLDVEHIMIIAKEGLSFAISKVLFTDDYRYIRR